MFPPFVSFVTSSLCDSQCSLRQSGSENDSGVWKHQVLPFAIHLQSICNPCSYVHYTSTYINMHQHASTYINTHQRTSAYINTHQHASTYIITHQRTSTYINIHQRTSTYINIHQHTSSHINTHQDTSSHINTHQDTSTHINVHRHTSNIHQHTSNIHMTDVHPQFAQWDFFARLWLFERPIFTELHGVAITGDRCIHHKRHSGTTSASRCSE